MKQQEDEGRILSRLVNLYESAEQATVDSRAAAERDRDYRNGDQWTADEIATLRKRKQPVVTIDRIGPKVDFLVGMESGARKMPRAYPRTPQDEESAGAASDALRFVMDKARWSNVRSACFENLIVEGSCGVDVRVLEKGDDLCIEILPIMWDRMFSDPHSRMRSWGDGAYKGQFLWMDVEDAIRENPGKEDIIEATMQDTSSLGNTYDDTPKTRWSDPKRKRVRIVEVWTKEFGTYYYSRYTKAGILERVESPYIDEEGEKEDGFVFGSCNIDRDGNRFGVVRRWISLQDEINKRRSKALHLMNVRQTYGNQSIGDKNKMRNELARPDGHVEMQGGARFGEDFGVIPTGDMAAAQFQLLQEAKGEIDAVGVNAALSGTEGRVMSGRALQSRQEQGMNELGPIFDAANQFYMDVYRKVWNRIRQFWTKEKWIRVTDDENNIKFVGLNRPVTLGEKLLDEFKQSGADPEEIAQAEQQAKSDPAMQQVVGMKNNVGQLDVDIVIDDAPASASLQGEQFETLAKIAPQAGSMPPQLFEALIEASTLRNKDKILAKLKGDDQQGKKSPREAQLEQQLAEMQKVMDQAAQKMQELQAEQKSKQVEQVAKAAELEIREYEAETNRLKVVGAGMTPEQVQAIATQAALQALQRDPLDGGDELEPEGPEAGGDRNEPPATQEPQQIQEPAAPKSLPPKDPREMTDDELLEGLQ